VAVHGLHGCYSLPLLKASEELHTGERRAAVAQPRKRTEKGRRAGADIVAVREHGDVGIGMDALHHHLP
jgi:hypothetical protein